MENLQELLINISPGPAVLLLALGILQCCFGYRMVRIWMTIWGALLLGWFGVLIAGFLSFPMLVGIAATVAAGAAGAVLGYKLYHYGAYMLCGICGFILGFLGGTVESLLMSLVCGAILAVFFGSAARAFLRPSLILSTGLVGGLAAGVGVMALLRSDSVKTSLILGLLFALFAVSFQYLTTRREAVLEKRRQPPFPAAGEDEEDDDGDAGEGQTLNSVRNGPHSGWSAVSGGPVQGPVPKRSASSGSMPGSPPARQTKREELFPGIQEPMSPAEEREWDPFAPSGRAAPPRPAASRARAQEVDVRAMLDEFTGADQEAAGTPRRSSPAPGTRSYLEDLPSPPPRRNLESQAHPSLHGTLPPSQETPSRPASPRPIKAPPPVRRRPDDLFPKQPGRIPSSRPVSYPSAKAEAETTGTQRWNTSQGRPKSSGICPRCGMPFREGAKFCDRCGCRLTE